MADRFPHTPHIDYCFSPIRISKLGRSYYVPCGKCDGCRLHKANEWSFRVGDEIENNPFSIWFTLTYSNEYVPKVKCVGFEDGFYHYHSCGNDFRFNGVRNVFRQPLDFYSRFYNYAPLHNYFDKYVIGVLRKDDVQLWLKLLRKKLYDDYNIQRSAFRYFIVGEYGTGKVAHKGSLRPHYHGIIFPENEEIASLLLGKSPTQEGFQESSLLYNCWQMSDRDMFELNTKYCNSGTRHYVTEYITSNTYLSPFYDDKDVKPFRLSSKKVSSIGFGHFDKKEVSQSIERGVITYNKSVSRVERNYIFQYPQTVVNSLFPKCSRYRELDYFGLYRIYGFLHFLRRFGRTFDSLLDGFPFDEFKKQDLAAAKACDFVCNLNNWSVRHYLDVLLEYYYLKEQRSLRFQYSFMQKYSDNPLLCIVYYSNWKDWLFGDFTDSFAIHHNDNVRNFLYGFGLVFSSSLEQKLDAFVSSYHFNYYSEVSDILSNSDKSKKANALAGLSPDS